ncbi:LysR family transcriptional regulator [Paremcibacter congregatus]|uniref:HTH lysR-type domain-containing protein n=1 Tax=Paremcibacter congregatus TaxID=2043170 RepID=A0A2G4YR20_9PROT|nr:LysR family transcriptional regulator [Paremcibacter congregatus]PHZ84784.1 hypothetical protein CRD36_10155 [Paremcibacter congregatus]QDE26237.1 LysR family transcriptional regulator [Paremcibacter congregatus]
MQLRQLKYFVVTAEELHFGKAADRLRLTQPALSLAIKQLEEKVGATLLERAKRRKVTLTTAGKILYKAARHMLFEADRVVENIYQAGQGAGGSLSIAHTDDYTSSFLPDILHQYNEQHPHCMLQFSRGLPFHLIERLNNRELDFIFATKPLNMNVINCNMRAIIPTPFVLVVPENHDLAKRGKIKLQDAADAHFLETPFMRRSPFEIKLSEILANADIAFSSSMDAASPYVLLEMVRMGYGVVISTREALPKSTEGLAIIKLDEPDAYMERGLYWRKDNSNPALQSFLELLEENKANVFESAII